MYDDDECWIFTFLFLKFSVLVQQTTAAAAIFAW